MAVKEMPERSEDPERTLEMMEDKQAFRDAYPGNSNASKNRVELRDSSKQPEPKQIRKVADAKVRKQGFLRRLGKSIIEDSIESAKEKAFDEIVVPGFKTLIFDTVNEIMGVMLFKDSGYGGRRSGGSRQGDRTSYRDYYDRKNRRGGKNDRRESSFEPDDIILDTRQKANEVLDELDWAIHKYGQASVADLYDAVGVTSDWTDNRYGWTSLRGATIRPVREGFLLVMPRTCVLDD